MSPQYQALVLSTLMTSALVGASDGGKVWKDFVNEHCRCVSHLDCKCCAHAKMEVLDFKQELCANWTISQNLDINVNLILNGGNIYSHHFSGRRLPAICAPILPIPLPILGCLRVHMSPLQHSRVRACFNVLLRLFTFDVVDVQTRCFETATSFTKDSNQLVEE